MWHESTNGAYYAVCSCGHETTRETLTDKTLSTIDAFAAHVLASQVEAIKERLLSDEAVEKNASLIRPCWACGEALTKDKYAWEHRTPEELERDASCDEYLAREHPSLVREPEFCDCRREAARAALRAVVDLLDEKVRS